MKIVAASESFQVGQRETTGEIPPYDSRTFEVDPRGCSMEISLTLVPESDEDYDRMSTEPKGDLAEWLVDLIALSTQQPMSAPRPTVVSIRPLIDGAPTMRQATWLGMTTSFPLAMVAIGPDGKPLQLSVEFEITVDR